MRVLGSSTDEFELHAEFPTSVDRENDCRGCPALERMEEIRSRKGDEEVDTMLQGVVRALEKYVRTSDQILLRPCGQIDVVLPDTDERRAGSVIQRLRTRMKGFWGPHVLEISSAVTIREGKKSMACEPIMRRGTPRAVPSESRKLRRGGTHRSMRGER